MIAAGLWALRAATSGLSVETVTVDGIPATVFRPASGPPRPAVVIAHGFAGSQQLMRSFATTLAHNGYVAVTFDFAGHARNSAPLTGNLADTEGATRTLIAQTAQIAAFARQFGDGRLAVIGHSMASDVVVRFSEATPDVGATIAVSMFSQAVTATEPRNLLVIVGGWEGILKREALRAIGLATSPTPAAPGVTYGDPARGTARRAAFSPGVEHVGVLYSRASLREAVDWLDRSFAIERLGGPVVMAQGPWILLLLAGVVVLARPLSRLLPRIAAPPAGASLGWRRMWLPLIVPMLATPFLLRIVPTNVLPVLVADYLTAHFIVFGLTTAACLAWLRVPWPSRASVGRTLAAAAAVIAFGFIGLVWPINAFVTSFLAGPGRLPLIAAMLVGTLVYFLVDEWLTRGPGAAAGAYAASKLALLVSLGIAVSLDFERLFFLIIILPVILPFFLVYGLFSAWTYRSTGQPMVAGIANATAFAWAIGVTFPLLAG
jgi:pimeloyl-ACP methyl ester carboxylesterase